MKARLQKWGNDLVLRIPEPLATQIGLEPDSQVELSLRGSKLVIEPESTSDLKLDDLLAGVTRDNVHGEVDTGTPTGGEVW
ncbi:MAG: AbrB/MazE/SpoVT family DNA-binding domain-containing protein [Gemmatimonadota bacterium]|nr:AbrB/MazE/SpoVT family DNA-binding domain-containing protein [Gemmatimonadota bacterium]